MKTADEWISSRWLLTSKDDDFEYCINHRDLSSLIMDIQRETLDEVQAVAMRVLERTFSKATV